MEQNERIEEVGRADEWARNTVEWLENCANLTRIPSYNSELNKLPGERGKSTEISKLKVATVFFLTDIII